jgi:thymidylate synthase (FAD)
MQVKLVWATEDLDAKLAYIARVSNPDNQNNQNIKGLLNYMLREGHVSPFEMANVCLEINTTRDIARQALRHKSFGIQEFSQRYAEVNKLGEFVKKEFRLQDSKNRQASIDITSTDPRQDEWEVHQQRVIDAAKAAYEWCIANGGAKEVARVVLPEGLTLSRMYFNGTMRSWIFYLESRLHESTQKEHCNLAKEILAVLRTVAPITMSAFFG